MTTAEFRELLLGIRDDANLALGGSQDGSHEESDARTVWHAAEIALGMLDPRYLPKRAAQLDVRDRLDNAWPADPIESARWN
jgi:hypothetical protein